MKTNQASKTAEYMALFRALESTQPASRRLFYDRLAGQFLQPRLRHLVTLSHVPLVGRLVPWLIDGRWPGARTSAVARTRYIDDALMVALKTGTRQVVILGAGFDGRAYRIPGIELVRVFEVDHPATQQAKRAALAHLRGQLPDHVQWVDIDFNTQQLDERLSAAGLCGDEPTFWIWEGVTNYLSAEAVSRTLTAIQQLARSGRIAFTYVHRAVLENPDSFPSTAALRQTLAAAGETWTFGLDPAELPKYLATRGFRLVQDIGSVDYRQRYLPARPRLLRGYEFYRLAIADVVGVD